MLSKISLALKTFATGKTILSLFVLLMIFSIFLIPSAGNRIESISNGVGFIDLLLSYTPETIQTMLSSYGNEGISFYKNFTITIDIFYPVIYSLFLSLLIAWLLKKSVSVESKIHYLSVVPLFAGIFDWFENINILIMLYSYPNLSSFVANLSSVCTSIKWGFSLLSTIVLIIAIIFYIRSKIYKNNIT
jgi:hypothetical protein